MAYLYNITTKINAFTYVTGVKPYICEFPKCLDHEFINFQKAIRITPATLGTSDHNIERDVSTDTEEYVIELKAKDFAKMNAVIHALQQGCRDFVPDTIYSNMYVDPTPYDVDTALVMCKLNMRATLSGVVY